jgi:hypothetical protein
MNIFLFISSIPVVADQREPVPLCTVDLRLCRHCGCSQGHDPHKLPRFPDDRPLEKGLALADEAENS